MVGYIYLITDTTNGMQYVGQHHYDKQELDPNYHGSGHIIKSIYKKRPHSLKEEYLKTCYSQKELDELEKYFIFLYNTLYPNGYNLAEGGRGGIPCEESRRKMSESNKGRHHTEETKRKISKTRKNNVPCGKEHYLFGRHLSEETKRKMSESNKGKHHSEETKRKLSEYRKELYKNEDVRIKLSEYVKKTMTPEHRKRLSEIKKERNMTKTVSQFTKDFVFVMEWSSLCEIERQLGYAKAAISRCCLGKQKTSYGFIWKYKD